MLKKIIRFAGTVAVLLPLSITNMQTALAAGATAWLPPVQDLMQGSFFPFGAPASEHFRALDEYACNGNTDYVWTNYSFIAVDEYRIPLVTIPNGKKITKIQFQPCHSAYTTAYWGDNLIYMFKWNGVYQTGWGYWIDPGLGTTPYDTPVVEYTFPTPLSKNSLSQAAIRMETGDLGAANAKISRVMVKFIYQ